MMIQIHKKLWFVKIKFEQIVIQECKNYSNQEFGYMNFGRINLRKYRILDAPLKKVFHRFVQKMY